MCMIEAAEPAVAGHSDLRRARKQHKCCECRRIIEPGEAYEASSMLFDGAWNDYKTCEHCLAVRKWLSTVCNGWVYEFVQEDLAEHKDEGYNPRWISIALSGMRKKWQRQDGSLWKPMKLPRRLPIGAG